MNDREKSIINAHQSLLKALREKGEFSILYKDNLEEIVEIAKALVTEVELIWRKEKLEQKQPYQEQKQLKK